MEDRFKFRVWNRIQKTMHKNIDDLSIWDYSHLVIMQCTGLEDKNRDLIYEGDVVIEDFGETGIYKVVFCQYTAKFEFVNLDDEDYDWQMLSRKYRGMGEHEGISKELRIIGNIYQNPELIK